jgi:hypothetical protein
MFSTAIAAFLLASPLAAQQLTDTPTPPRAGLTEASAPVSSPSFASAQAAAPVGARIITVASPLAPTPTPRQVDRNPALMIVGGAMLLAGAVIGGNSGTIIMIGGAGIGLLGLWNFLR